MDKLQLHRERSESLLATLTESSSYVSCEVCPDHRLETNPVAYVVDGRSYATPEWLLYPRMCQLASSPLLFAAIGVSNTIYVANAQGMVKAVRTDGAGQMAVTVQAQGDLMQVMAVVAKGHAYVTFMVDANLVISNMSDPIATPFPEGTSQGFLDWNVWTDANRIRTFGDITFVLPMTRGGYWVGQTWQGTTDGVGLVKPSGDVYWIPGLVTPVPPRLAINSDGVPIVAVTTTEGVFVGPGAFVPMGGTPPPPPTPPPPSPPPPNPPPPNPEPPPPVGGPMQSDLVISPLGDLSHLTEVPHPAGQGLYGLKTDDGKFKSWHDGTWQPNKDGMGPWEAFLPYGGVYLARRNDGDEPRQAVVGSRLPDTIPAP